MLFRLVILLILSCNLTNAIVRKSSDPINRNEVVDWLVEGSPSKETTQPQPVYDLYRRSGNSSREVFVQFQLNLTYYARILDTVSTAADSDFVKLIQNAFLEVQGDGANGNLRIGLGLSDARGLAAFAEDLGLRNLLPAPLSRFLGSNFVRSINVGATVLNNAEILDPATGQGLLADLWSTNDKYQFKGHSSVDFVFDVLRKFNIEIPSGLQNFYDAYKQRIATSVEDFVVERVPLIGTKFRSDGSGVVDSWVYDLTEERTPLLKKQFDSSSSPPAEDFTTIQDATGTKAGATQKFSARSQIADFFQDRTPSETRFWVSAGDIVDSVKDPLLGVKETRIGTSTSAAGARDVAVRGTAELALVRSRGVLNIVKTIAASAIEIVGIAEVALAPLFIILDLINGDWKAAVFGAVSAIGGLLAGSLIGGPLGIFAGAAISLFFSIFPGIFNSKGTPQTNNPATIVQNAFFGDPSRTGNEQCNKERKKQGLSENCTAVYGAGTISKITNWGIYDAYIFMIANNDGYPMSIVDIASKLPVKDYTVSNWESDKPAYIDCGKSAAINARQIGVFQGYTPTGDSNNMKPSSGYRCGSAKFVINRSLIKLPGLNATADKIYDRIIPAPGGDCKLLSDPEGSVKLPYVDLSITGRPVGIACNVTLSNIVGINPNLNLATVSGTGINTTTQSAGTLLVWNAVTNSSVNVTSVPVSNPPNTSGSSTVQSTDGSLSRAFRAAPPPTELLRYNSLNAACMSAPGQYLCLPNGTYEVSTGSLGYDMRSINGLSLPVNGSLTFSIPSYFREIDAGKVAYTDETYTDDLGFYENITSSSPGLKDFQKQIGELAISTKIFSVSIPTKATPGVCFFTAVQFKGDVQCYGLGGNSIPDIIGSKAQSLTIIGDAEVYLYSGSYGDTTSKWITQKVADLNQVEDGSVYKFAKRIKAIWVTLPPDIFNPGNTTTVSATNLTTPTILGSSSIIAASASAATNATSAVSEPTYIPLSTVLTNTTLTTLDTNMTASTGTAALPAATPILDNSTLPLSDASINASATASIEESAGVTILPSTNSSMEDIVLPERNASIEASIEAFKLDPLLTYDQAELDSFAGFFLGACQLSSSDNSTDNSTAAPTYALPVLATLTPGDPTPQNTQPAGVVARWLREKTA